MPRSRVVAVAVINEAWRTWPAATRSATIAVTRRQPGSPTLVLPTIQPMLLVLVPESPPIAPIHELELDRSSRPRGETDVMKITHLWLPRALTTPMRRAD